MEKEFPLKIEEARSGRSECGVCHTFIKKGEFRVGTQRIFFRRGPVVKWHHVSCALEGALVSESLLFDLGIKAFSNEPIASSPKVNNMNLLQKFSGAARAAIYPDIAAFRENIFRSSNGNPICPIRGITLDRDNCHVHHSGPNDFNVILKEFIFDMDISRISYTGNHFSNPVISKQFRKFHRDRCRLLLVHKEANLSDLKLRPNLALCDICSKTEDLNWIFDRGICDTCKLEMTKWGSKGLFVSKAGSIGDYGVSATDLEGLFFEKQVNPIKKQFAPMKLFRRADVETVAARKYGSVEKALNNQMIKRERREKSMRLQCLNVASFNMSLRSGRAPKVRTEFTGRFATYGQKRAMKRGGMEVPFGISFEEAYLVINEYKSKRKKTSGASLTDA